MSEIKPEQVPDAVARAMKDAMLREGSTFKDITAAALTAWPGAFPWTFTGPLEGHGYILPLAQTQENPDDKA